jgi:glucokinase
MKKCRQPLLLGIDLGATHCRLGIVNPVSGGVRHLTRHQTAGLSLPQFCRRVEEVAQPCRQNLAGVGIGFPGFCDHARRCTVTTGGAVPFLEGCDLADAVEPCLGVPVIVDNDARAHAAGEFQFGGWGKPKSLVVVTLGTGVGLAWHVDGRLYPPPDFGAQGGHMTVNWPGGNPCYCGLAGCLESLASGTAMAATANERLALFLPSRLRPPVCAEQLCELGQSDALAKECIQRAVESLRGALRTLHHLYFPDVVVLGGSVARGLWPYLGPLCKWFASMDRYDGRSNRLVLSRLGDKAGVLGAAILIQRALSQEARGTADSVAAI